MMAKMIPTLLLTLFTGVCPLRLEDIYVNAGGMVVLQCPQHIGHSPNDDTNVIWTSYSKQEMYVISNISSAAQRQMLLHGRSLVIPTTSVNHEGNYSCSLRNASRQSWFRLTVYTPPSTEIEDRTTFSIICYTQESCTLTCPDVYIPDMKSLNISSCLDIMWRKEGESLRNKGYFSSVEREDQGIYTCTRSYLYHGQRYNMTFTINLDVQPNGKHRRSMILSPSKTDVFNVQLGTRLVIDCKAVVNSDFDELFWLSDTSFVELNDSLPVYYTYHTSDHKRDQLALKASLIFKKVSEEDLSRRYTCKLDSVSQLSSFVTITLSPKARPFSLFLALSIVGVLVVVAALIVVYVKFKIHITLFVRDTIRCHKGVTDGKSYDAFLMFYESETDTGLNEDNKKWLQSVLEERFGYSLCLYDRNSTPAAAEAEAVLDCIEQSRKVVLVPTPPDCGLASATVTDVSAALVERQNHLVFIKTETIKAPTSCALPQALDLRRKSVNIVTWKDTSSKSNCSSFFRQLRYYLSAPQHPPKVKLLSLTAAQYDIC